MSKDYGLSEGALQTIMLGGDVGQPIMQVLGSKKVLPGQADKERFRLLLSDGKYFISFAMLTTQINADVGSGHIPDFSVIKLSRYITSVINNAGKGDKRVLVVLDLEVLHPGNVVGGKIGNPTVLSDVVETNGAPKEQKQQTNGSVYTNGSASVTASSTTVMDQSVNLGSSLTNPISSLSPYQNKWVIKAKVFNKSQIRTWSNSRGEGKLFSVDLIDESGEIRATAFRDMVDKFYDLLQIDKVYYISKCQLKSANKNFSNLKNEYEMTFTNDTIIQECHDDIGGIPQTTYNFLSIDKIAQVDTGALIDVIGICKSVSDLSVFTAKSSGRELKKRELSLVDQSNCAVTLALWGSDAESFGNHLNSVIAIKGAKVGEFGGGKNLSLFAGTLMKINPDITEAFRLRGWYDNGGNEMVASNISSRGDAGFSTQWMSLKEARDSGLGTGDKGDYFQVMGTILLVRSENCVYKACPTEECNKKIVDQSNGMYKCEKCNREYPNFKYRLLLSANVGDWSGTQWISMFSSEAEKVLGKTSKEVGEAMEEGSEALLAITDEAHFKQFILKCRIKMETYNDESRLKVVAVKVEPLNYAEYNNYLISRIQELTN